LNISGYSIPTCALIHGFRGLKVNYWQQLVFVSAITLPVFSLVFIGVWLKWRNKLDEGFTSSASYLVFNLALPVLMFAAIVRTDINAIANLPLVGFAVAFAIINFLLVWLPSQFWIENKRSLGVFVQGSFRSNLGILGLAFCMTTFDQAGLAIGAVLLAVITPIYNVLSIFALSHSAQQGRMDYWSLLKDVITNPLILAILLALPFAYWQVELPQVAMRAVDYLAAMTLPLALICIGASLSLSSLRQTQLLSWLAVVIKLVILPLAVAMIGAWLGFTGVELGCLILMFASPTAAASYVMVRSIGGDHHFAANIIALTTLVSLFTVSIAIYLLKVFAIV
jgi:predicted permease